MQPRTAGETLSPLGQSLGESLAVTRHMLLVAAPLGALVGVAIAGYDWIVNELLWRRVTERSPTTQMVAPFFGLLLAGLLLRLFRVTSSSMADEVVKAYHEPGAGMPTRTAAGKFVSSIATMGLGGSAGMEGASKWVGATIGSLVQTGLNRLGLRSLHWNVKTTLIAGGSAGIAAIFRAPLSGAVMGVESPYKHDLAHEALLPALVASATSFWAFSLLRPARPYFPVPFHYVLESRDLLVAVPLGIVAGLGSHAFLWTLGRARRWFEGLAVPLPVRMALGGAMVAAVAFVSARLLGKPVTLQAGLPIANELLGIAAFSGASYNSLLFSAVFVAEATGNVFLVVPALVASSVAFAISAGVSNSRSQRKRRPGWREQLRAIPIAEVMTTSIVTAHPDQTLESFSRSVLLEHHFKALPVVDAEGVLLGMIGLQHLRSVPTSTWGEVRVGDVLDPAARTICSQDSVSDAESALRSGPYDYVPVVDPDTSALVGIVSDSDVYRAVGEHVRQPAA